MSSSPTVLRRRLGQELLRLRRDVGLTGEQVAERMEWSASKVYRVEGGRSGIRPKELRELLDIYGVKEGDHVRDAMITLAREGRKRGWWAPYADSINQPYQTYVGLESEAAEVRCFETLVVNGLLQTQEYARAAVVASSPEDSRDAIDRRVKLRLERQQLLHKERSPLHVSAVLDESVLRRRIGGPEVMYKQLSYLLRLMELPNISVRVLPHAVGAYPGMVSSFTIVRFPNPADDDIVYVEALAGDLYVEAEAAKRYTVAHETLRAAALGVAASAELIETVVAEYVA